MTGVMSFENTKFYIFTDGANELEELFFREIVCDPNVCIVSKNKCFKNKLLQKIFRIHFSFRINNKIRLPFKKIWYPLLDRCNNNSDCDGIYIFQISWYYPGFFKYIQKKHPNSKVVIYFSDTIVSKQKVICNLNIQKIKDSIDAVYSYNPQDVKEYGLKYLSICYSRFPDYDNITTKGNFDLVFIGAERNRYSEIERVYQLAKKHNLKVFFYIFSKNADKYSSQPDFIVSSKLLSMIEYLRYVKSSKCLLEILDPGTKGTTLRFWDAVMYDKYLITNNKNVTQSIFYKTNNIVLYNDVNDIDFSILKNCNVAQYNYNGENSPSQFIKRVYSDLYNDDK